MSRGQGKIFLLGRPDGVVENWGLISTPGFGFLKDRVDLHVVQRGGGVDPCVQDVVGAGREGPGILEYMEIRRIAIRYWLPSRASGRPAPA